MSDAAGATDVGSEAAPEVAPANLDADNISADEAFDAYVARKTKSTAESAEPATAETESAQADAAPVTDHGEDDEAEPAAKPLIERPKSWAKELDEEWASYPREAQEKIAKREQERDAATRRSQNEAADIRKAAEAERVQAEQARKAYEAKLPTLMQTLQDAQSGAFADVRTVDDVAKLASEDPFRYIQWQAHQTKLQAVNAELQRAEGEKRTAAQKDFAEFAKAQSALFDEGIPDADRPLVEKMKAKAGDFLASRGFKAEELNGVLTGDKFSLLDHRVQGLILDAMRFNEAKSAPAKAVPRAVPPVQRPGTAPAGTRTDNIQALTRKLSESGDVDDAFALYQARQRSRRA